MTPAAARFRVMVLVAAGATAGLAACQPPVTADAGAAVPVVQTPADDASGPQILPPAVEATVRKLQQLGETGKDWEMAALAEQTPGFRSNDGGMSHRAYWNLKLRTGDWPMEHMRLVLLERFARLETARGPIYVWPDVAALAPIDITPRAAREMDRLAGEGTAERMRAGERWPGYVLGIAEDGTWLFFYSGSG